MKLPPAYVKDVLAFPLLSPEEEKILFKKYADSKDRKVFDKIVNSNLRLVITVCNQSASMFKNLSYDLVQEGNIGLMRAVEKFNPERNLKFSTYAFWWIRAYILRYLMQNRHMLKFGSTVASSKLFYNLNKERERLSSLGMDASDEALASLFNVSLDEIQGTRARLTGEVSLDAPVGDDSNGTRLDSIASEDNPEETFESEETRNVLRLRFAEFKKTLSPVEIVVFDNRMVSENPMTLADIGSQVNLTRERIRQIEAKLYSRLRKFIGNDCAEAMLGHKIKSDVPSLSLAV